MIDITTHWPMSGPSKPILRNNIRDRIKSKTQVYTDVLGNEVTYVKVICYLFNCY